MLEPVGQALGELRGALGVAGANGAADGEQVGGERGRETVAAPAHERVQPADGAVESLHRRGERPAAFACGGEVDHLSHATHDGPPL